MTGKSDIWFAVLNVYAASKKAVSYWASAEKRLKERSLRYDCAMTGKDGSAKGITVRACRQGYRRLLAVGGDGTIHDVLNGIAYNPTDKKIYLTGKNWPKMYEVKLVENK